MTVVNSVVRLVVLHASPYLCFSDPNQMPKYQKFFHMNFPTVTLAEDPVTSSAVLPLVSYVAVVVCALFSALM